MFAIMFSQVNGIGNAFNHADSDGFDVQKQKVELRAFCCRYGINRDTRSELRASIIAIAFMTVLCFYSFSNTKYKFFLTL